MKVLQDPSLRQDSGRQSIRCLVVQISSQSALFQSLMALRAAKQLYPQLELHLLVREEYAESVSRVSWVEGILTLPTAELMDPLKKGERSIRQTMGPTARWLGTVAGEHWDMVVNWSYSETSSWLTSLIPASSKLGFSRCRDTTFACMDDWSIYVQSIIQQDVPQNIHLTDVYTTQLLTALQINYGNPADAGNEVVTSKSFFDQEDGESEVEVLLSPDHHWVALQLGSLTDEAAIYLIREILRNHPDYGVALLGDATHLQQIKKIESKLKSRHRLVSLVSKSSPTTEFSTWSAAVSRCRWLISSESASVHLAGVLGTRVFYIGSDFGRLPVAGPYGNGHIVLEKLGDQVLDPEQVYAIWTYVMRGSFYESSHDLLSHLEAFGIDQKNLSFRIYRSRIRTLDDGGGVVYDLISSQVMRPDDWSSAVMGQLARLWYCGWVAPLGHELQRERVGPELLQFLRQLEESTRVLKHLLDESLATVTLLIEKSRGLQSETIMRLEDKKKIQDLGRRLEELDQLIERVGAIHKPLKGFSIMLRVVMHNLAGSHLSEMGKESAHAYVKIKSGVDAFLDWIRRTREIVRPQAIRGGGNLVTIHRSQETE